MNDTKNQNVTTTKRSKRIARKASKPEIVFYKSHLAELPLTILLIFLIIMALKLTATYPFLIQKVPLETPWFSILLPIPLFAIFPLIVGVYIIHSLYDRRYVIGTDYVRATEGRLSFNKRDTQLNFRDIRGVEVERSIFGRIFNIGDLKIGSAMQSDVELVIDDVDDPSMYRDIVLRRIDEYLSRVMDGELNNLQKFNSLTSERD